MNKRHYYQNAQVAQQYEAVRFSSEGGTLAHEREMSEICRTFQPGQKIVELACGTGRLRRALRMKGWNSVWGLDQSAAMINAGGHAKDPQMVVGDVFKMPFESNSFDGAYCFRFTNHYQDLEAFFAEALRILKPGGILLFDSMHWSLLLHNQFRWGGRNYVVRRNVLKQRLENSGWVVEQPRPLFLLSPYLLGRVPAPLARWLMSIRRPIPQFFLCHQRLAREETCVGLI